MAQQFHRAIVVGGSSGIGRELAIQLARRGCKVASVARRAEPLGENITTYAHDVTHYAEVPALFQQICHDLGGLDVIIYSSGIMPSIAPDEYNFEKDHEMVAVNLLGAIAWLNEAAQRFGNAKGGTIVGIGSVAGDRGRAPQPVYGTTKAAFETYLESLRNRLGTEGVKVVTIKPGPVATPMTEGLQGLPLLIKAEDAARQILAAAESGTRVAYVPKAWKPIMALFKSIPSPLFQRLKK